MTATGLADAAALILAGIFAWAGVAKFIGRTATTASFEALGLVAPGVLVVVVPLVELSAAVLLVLVAPVGAALALFLLVCFTVVLLRAMRSGLRVDCACFGAVPGREITPVDVVRNIGLAIMCQFAMFGGSPIGIEPVPLAVAAVVVVIGWASLRAARGAPGDA